MLGKFGAGSPAAQLAVQAGMGKAAGWGGGDPPCCIFPIFWGLLGLCRHRSAPEHPAAAGERLDIINGFEKSPSGDGGEDVSGAVPLRVSPPHPGLLNYSSYTKKSKTECSDDASLDGLSILSPRLGYPCRGCAPLWHPAPGSEDAIPCAVLGASQRARGNRLWLALRLPAAGKRASWGAWWMKPSSHVATGHLRFF